MKDNSESLNYRMIQDSDTSNADKLEKYSGIVNWGYLEKHFQNGALIYDGSEYIKVNSPKVDAVDSNGAGDLFAGAFLYGITNGKSYKEAGELACACSANLVTQFGARLTKEKILEIKG